MKYALLVCSICCLIIPSCVSSYFKTPNDLYKTSATIYLDDGTKKSGDLTIQFETGYDYDYSVNLYHKETRTTEKISFQSIKYYTIKNDYYYPKQVDVRLDGKYYLLFLKRLTPENSKIQFFQLDVSPKIAASGQSDKLYFISPPTTSRFEAWNIYGKKLFPDFEYKMSSLVVDCPEVADKIQSKADGYYIANSPFVSDQKKVDVFKRIIAEYDSCINK
jgi:hypothetical protein